MADGGTREAREVIAMKHLVHLPTLLPSAKHKAPAVDARVRAVARRMLRELENGYLEVCLTEAPEVMHSGHKVRAVCSQNAHWYRNYCEKHTSCTGRGSRRRKRPRTYIKRRNTIRGLRNLIAGIRIGIDAERLESVILREIAKRKRAAATAGQSVWPF